MTFVSRLIPIGSLLLAFSIHAPAVAESQVSLQDVQRYLATFTSRPMPSVRPQTNYQAMVGMLKPRDAQTAWYVGQWATKDGFVAVYPAAKPGTVCVITKTSRTVAYAEGRADGAVLRTANPLFTDEREQFLKYAALDLFVPVLHRDNAYLVWGLHDPNKARSRFLTLGFQNLPPDPNTFLPSGRTGDAIKAQFAATGCHLATGVKSPPAPPSPGTIVQTIDGVTAKVVRMWGNEFQIQFTNNTSRDFGFYANRVTAYDQSNRRVPVQFTSLVHGLVARPGGILRGTINTFRQTPVRIQVPEATPQGRVFKLQIIK